MLELSVFALFIVLCIIASLFDDPSCNHKHDFDSAGSMGLFWEGVLVGRYCSHPHCSVMRWEENTESKEK